MPSDNYPQSATKRPGSKAALLAFLKQHVGVVLTSRELQKAANGASEWGRRLRELRDEDGYQIKSHKDDASLKPDQYRLDTIERRPTQLRLIDKKLRAQILSAAAGVCQWCGAEAGRPHPEYPEKLTRLQVAHRVDKAKGGTDHPSNLIALCSFCNEGASVETPEPSREIQLYTLIRRAPQDVQRRVFERLRKKFGEY